MLQSPDGLWAWPGSLSGQEVMEPVPVPVPATIVSQLGCHGAARWLGVTAALGTPRCWPGCPRGHPVLLGPQQKKHYHSPAVVVWGDPERW